MRRKGQNSQLKTFLFSLAWMCFVSNSFAQTVIIKPEDPAFCQFEEAILFAEVSDGEAIEFLWSYKLDGQGDNKYDVLGEDNDTVEVITDTPDTYTYRVEVTFSGTPDTKITAETTVIIHELPDVTFSSVDACEGDPAFDLTQGQPSGGIYRGKGIIASPEFDPLDAGVGNQTITYIYTDTNGCTDSAKQTVTVNALPEVSFSAIDPVCEDASAFDLNQGSPGGGTYFGSGITASPEFNPSDAGVGTRTITYTYTDGNSCSKSATQTVTVYALPVVSFSTVDPVCEGVSAFNLTQGDPAGGTYSGHGISDSPEFDPSEAGVGTHTITYTYTDNNLCTNSNTQTVTVNALPTITFDTEAVQDVICEGDTAIIPIKLTGAGPWEIQYTADAIPNSTTVHTPNDTLYITPDSLINYIFTHVTDSIGCTADVNETITVEVQMAPYAGRDSTVLICNGDSFIISNGDTINNLFPFLGGNADEGGTWIPEIDIIELGLYTYRIQGTGPCSEYADSAKVIVSEAQTPAQLSIVGKPYDHPVLLIYPENELEYRWYIEGEESVLDTGQYYLFDRPGNYFVKVNIPGSYCITESEMFTVFPLDDTEVVKSYAAAFDFFPNPANDQFTLILKEKPVSDMDHLSLKIVSIEGECVFERSISNVMEGINIQRLKPGIYMIYLVSDDQIYGTQKLLIAR